KRPRVPVASHAATAVRKKAPACAMPVPRVNAIGGGPSSQNDLTSSGSDSFVPSKRPKPARRSCGGQSSGGAAYQLGNNPITSCGDSHQRKTRRTEGKPNCSRNLFSDGQTSAYPAPSTASQ